MHPVSKNLSISLAIIAIFIVVNTPRCHGKDLRNRLGAIGNASSSQGNDTDIEKFPYQVSIEKLRIHSCGGSILSDSWILTAAQCVHPATSGTFGKRIRAGSTTAIPMIEWSGSIHEIERTEIHSLFDQKFLDFDIAMLKVANKLIFSSRVQPIKVAKFEYAVKYEQNATATGWGKTSVDSWWHSVRLQSAQLPIFKTYQCDEIVRSKRKGYTWRISNRMICAGGNGTDNFLVDSGSPLVQKGLLIGIASWGITDSDQLPSFYTHVARYDMRIFINTHIGL